MSGPAPRHEHTFAEYLELEEIARVRHEFYRGEIYAMVGGTPEHAAMAAEITSQLGRQLDGTPCRAYSSDLRVRVKATGLATAHRALDSRRVRLAVSAVRGRADRTAHRRGVFARGGRDLRRRPLGVVKG